MPPENIYIYTHRAVAFLDVLGFQNKLNEFENDFLNKCPESCRIK